MATALLIAGAGLVVAGKVKEGQVAAAQGDFAKKIAIKNKQSLDRQASAEKDASKIDAERIARQEKIVTARMEVGQSKSGIGLKGATLNALTDAAAQFSLDRNLTLRRGMIRSRELRLKGGILASEGRFAKVVGRQRRTSLFTQAAGTALLSGSKLGGGGKTQFTTNPQSTISSPVTTGTFGASRNFPSSAF